MQQDLISLGHLDYLSLELRLYTLLGRILCQPTRDIAIFRGKMMRVIFPHDHDR